MNLCKYKFEVCVETIEQCLSAEEKGADRIELCADLCVGGTTPSYGIVKKAKEILKIPVFVIIRPRGGNFIYNYNEIEIMKYDIESLKSLNVEGFVIGILNKNNEIDWENLTFLTNNCNNIDLTFHMAFDSINDDSKLQSIDKLISLGFKRILTKGSQFDAPSGIINLKKYNINIRLK